MTNTQDEMDKKEGTERPKRLEQARVMAKLFCQHFRFPGHHVGQLGGDPIQKPLVIERDGQLVEVYRWLGHGRGAPIVQVEINLEDNSVCVYGGFADQEFGPWRPPRT